jgi:hypothetical protein
VSVPRLARAATPQLWKLIRWWCEWTQCQFVLRPKETYLVHENRACKHILLHDAPSFIEYRWLRTHTAATHLWVITVLSCTGSHQIITRQRRADSYSPWAAVRTGVSSGSVATSYNMHNWLLLMTRINLKYYVTGRSSFVHLADCSSTNELQKKQRDKCSYVENVIASSLFTLECVACGTHQTST